MEQATANHDAADLTADKFTFRRLLESEWFWIVTIFVVGGLSMAACGGSLMMNPATMPLPPGHVETDELVEAGYATEGDWLESMYFLDTEDLAQGGVVMTFSEIRAYGADAGQYDEFTVALKDVRNIKVEEVGNEAGHRLVTFEDVAGEEYRFTVGPALDVSDEAAADGTYEEDFVESFRTTVESARQAAAMTSGS